MLIFKIVLFLILMVALPYTVGTCFAASQNLSQKQRGFRTWNLGMLIMYTVFEGAVLIGTFAHMSLSYVTIIWILVLFFIIVAGGYCVLRQGEGWKWQIKQRHMDQWERILLLLVVISVLYQIIYVCFNMHVDDDDAYYVGMAVTSWFSDSVSVNHPYLGTAVSLDVMANYALSPFAVYCAMWSKLMGIHPAIFMRSVFPAVNISWCYIVYYLLSKVLFRRFCSRMEFLIIIVMAHLFGAYSGTTPAVFLLTRIWQGKALIAAIFIPMLWYLWIKAYRNKEKIVWVEMFFAVCASCLSSSMALFLCPILLGAFGLQSLLEEKRWEKAVKLMLCAMPCLVLAICELFLVYR